MSYPFIQARHFTQASGRTVDVLVIHTMEAPEAVSTAENVAHWFAGSTAPQASAHYCIDSNSIVQCVQDEDVAWHAPGANSDGLGFEHAGFASQGHADWNDTYSAAMLKLSAGLVAAKCKEHQIPVVWLSPADLRAGRRGITGHNNVSEAFRLSTHTDPGSSFPIQEYLGLVRAKLGNAAPADRTQKPSPKTIAEGASGWRVKRVQKLLRSRGYHPGPADGAFDQQVVTAVQHFQSDHGLDDDGIVGPKTWQALLSAPPAGDGGSHPLLQSGDHGEQVTLLQRLLADQDCDPGPIDGIFGKGTQRAVKQYQSAHKLDVDGVAGPQTWQALEAKVAALG